MRVIDVGCGPGIYVTELRKLGIDAIGVDTDRNTAGSHCFKIDATSQEFRDKFHGFDVALCLEVGEHLPPSMASKLVQSLTSCADLVLFSAAVPGQGGIGHINCQPKQYWIDHFASFGYVVDENMTVTFLDFMRNGPHMGWLTQNAMIFRPYGDIGFDTIIAEEGPQATRIAEYFHQMGS